MFILVGIFGRLEPDQINRCEFFFLHRIRVNKSPSFSTFFLDKCDFVRQRVTGEIYIGGLITIIGRAVSLDFPSPEYVPVDNPPNFLLGRDAFA